MTTVRLMLQVNQTGAWRHCLQYSYADGDQVCAHAAELARIAGAKLRVLDPDGKPVAWWTAERGWHNPFGVRE